MNYTAIDFETANTSASSACAIGLATFSSEGELVETYYTLLRPRELYFDIRCQMVHGISPEKIISAPSLEDVWSDILLFIGKNPLVAHNAPFDMKVFKDSAASFNLSGLESDYYCTLSLARKVAPGLASYRLTSLADHFDLGLYDAHMALDDAITCGKLFHVLCGSCLSDKTAFDAFMRKNYRDRRSGYPKRIVTEDSLLFS